MRIMLANFTKMVDDAGGLAKVCCSFANEMTKRGHEVSLVYSDERSGRFFFSLEEEIRCRNLKVNADGSVIKFPTYLKAWREAVRAFDKRAARTVNSDFDARHLLPNLRKYLDELNPDIIVSYQPAASKLLLCDLHTTIPVITMSHGDPGDYFKTYPRKEIPALEKSAICQVLMPSFEKRITDHLPNAKTITIGNAIPQFAFSADLTVLKKVYKIIWVGRITKNHKRPHLLLQAFIKLADKFPNWQLELWGAKDREAYYKELQVLISEHDLDNRVFFKGSTNDVPSKLHDADIFAFPSAYEGFGMALAEAMSAGLPVVGYKNCAAVNELIEDGRTGFLCADGVEPLADALEKLMGNQALRARMGRAAKVAMQAYAPEKIWDQWEALMKKIVIERQLE
jgi:glycosyltransferase involved in cell wall biosynthesis